jgi:DNA-binding transcriptional LysR family regulator
MSRLPDLEAMAIFATVVETRGITAAAVALSLSAPTVSKALTRLEQRIGAPLFHRTSRRLTLTDAGRDLAARASRMLAEAEAAEAALMEQAANPRGLVRLTAPMSFGMRAVGPLLPDFLTRYPDVTIDLHLTDATVDLVAEGFDIALRIGILPDSSLRARRLRAIPRSIVATPAYLDRRGRPAHPNDLQTHHCFGYAYLQTRDAWTFVHDNGEQVIVRPSGPLRVNNADAMMPALLAGLGIAIMPDFMVQDALAAGLLEPVLSEWRRPDGHLYLVTPPHPTQPARIRALADHLAHGLAERLH